MSDPSSSSQIPLHSDKSNQKQPSYYFIDDNGTKEYDTIQPSFRSDVIRLYGLLELSQSLARTKPDGSKGVKLRKSYKNHILDLPGKLNIPNDRTLSSVVAGMENPDMAFPEIQPFDENELRQAFNFEKSSSNGVPGFDSSLLALGPDSSSIHNKKERKRKQATPSAPAEQPELKRRHVQVHFD
ncbi:unnamed protein product [Ambrosiozyma monospora]|uniref:Unnamed protein product n=1 Tax=Ambrosiozyma monospora TaxID=43982 RepID=A0ACB5T7F0_AMBMO|nr:unnamed protein product [Ambrosiozyma monospora]